MSEFFLQEQIINKVFDSTSRALRITPDVAWDECQGTKPNAVTEVYMFYYQTVLVLTTTVTFEDSTKEFIQSITKV